MNNLARMYGLGEEFFETSFFKGSGFKNTSILYLAVKDD